VHEGGQGDAGVVRLRAKVEETEAAGFAAALIQALPCFDRIEVQVLPLRARKTSPSGDSMLMLASTPSVVSAANTVKVRQCPAGTASRTRSERGPQP
jgi:hypothetical protein